MWSRQRGPTTERGGSPLWQWPAVCGALAATTAWLLHEYRPKGEAAVEWLPGSDPGAATALLQVTATSVMTATTLTFSLTLVALQLASQQFSPRLLREFTRDRVTKAVLSVLTAALLFASTGLLLAQADEPIPQLTVVGSYLLSAASLVAILAFITHIMRLIRVDTMMLMVHDETSKTIGHFYPEHDTEPPRTLEELGLTVGPPSPVPAERSGFVRSTDVDALVEAARTHDAVIRVEVRAGDHVVEGTPIATAWQAPPPGDEADNLVEGVRSAITLGYERTMDQDTAFGFRQLEDIAVKAMSPGINDPVTADHAVGHMAGLLVDLLARRLGHTIHEDADGHSRLEVPDRDLRYYLDLASGQLRRFGAEEPTVLVSLLRMLRDAATACRDEDQRREIRRAARLVLTEAEGIRAEDMAPIEDLADRVEHALAGRVDEAYADRSGETRSI